jgi:hypothetical protein
MLRSVLAIGVLAALTTLAVAQKEKEEPKGEVLKTIISVMTDYDKDKNKLTITAVGQVPTGGWTGAKLTRRMTKEAPKDGIYEFELTAVRPTGIVTQALSKVKATLTWENLPADLKGIRVLGSGDGVMTVIVEK